MKLIKRGKKRRMRDRVCINITFERGIRNKLMRSLGFALWGEIEREGENFAEAQATPAMAEIERDSLHERKLTFFFPH